MSIRMGGAGICSLAMITPESRVEETRRYLINPTQWYEISKKCIAEKKFLILTICIGFNSKLEYMPTETQWRNIVEDSTVKLLALGGNKYNCRIDIINEPNKYCTKEKYVWLVNIAYNQIGGRLKMGAGCDELNYQDFYIYLSSHGKFNTLVIHIQGACNTEAKTSYYTNFAKNLAVTYNRGIDCNEACYQDVATSSGFNLLKMQLKYAEQIGCANFCNVFNNLDQSAFSQNTDKWKFLCFKVNGVLRSNYWTDWKILMITKCPVPNIKEIIIDEDDDMKLDSLYYKDRPIEKYVRDPAGRGIMFLRQCFKLSSSNVFDAALDSEVRNYQIANGLVVDGKVGPKTFGRLILEADYQKFYNWIHHDWATYS